jgi:hypothetical protein
MLVLYYFLYNYCLFLNKHSGDGYADDAVGRVQCVNSGEAVVGDGCADDDAGERVQCVSSGEVMVAPDAHLPFLIVVGI